MVVCLPGGVIGAPEHLLHLCWFGQDGAGARCTTMLKEFLWHSNPLVISSIWTRVKFDTYCFVIISKVTLLE